MSYRQTVFRFVFSDAKLVYSALYTMLTKITKAKLDFCYGFGKTFDFDHGDTYEHVIYENKLIWHR